MQLKKLMIFPFLLWLSACGQNESQGFTGSDVSGSPLFSETEYNRNAGAGYMVAQKARNPNLAYEHNYEIDLDNEKISERYEATLNLCNQEDKYLCTILESAVNSGDWVSAVIKVRIKGEGVRQLIDTASEGGEITSENSRAEDLSEIVADNKKRLQMLLSYQEKLLNLESKASQDIDSLIKVTSELSRVQSDIERAKGSGEALRKRTLLDLVNIRLYSSSKASFWGKIGEAFADFGDNLSEGIASAIIGVAYLLPWLILIAGFIFLVRWLWRLLRRKSHGS